MTCIHIHDSGSVSYDKMGIIIGLLKGHLFLSCEFQIQAHHASEEDWQNGESVSSSQALVLVFGSNGGSVTDRSPQHSHALGNHPFPREVGHSVPCAQQNQI